MVRRSKIVCRRAALGLRGLSLRAAALAVALVGMAVSAGTASAQQAVTLPDIGFEVGDYVTAAATTLGAVVAVVAGVFFMFVVVRKGFTWGKRAL